MTTRRHLGAVLRIYSKCNKHVYLIKTTLQKFFIFGYVAADKLCFQFMQKILLLVCEEHTDHMTTSKSPILQ